MNSAYPEVVVVGAGIVGASITFQLARRCAPMETQTELYATANTMDQN